ncbi:hypothetical protein LA345_23395 [Burkholderia vietnamiensis]|nr:hypothetical protein [Burkholderia vietnamiensis]
MNKETIAQKFSQITDLSIDSVQHKKLFNELSQFRLNGELTDIQCDCLDIIACYYGYTN